MSDTSPAVGCFPTADAAFGPGQDCRPFDFTIAFEQYIFSIAPPAIFILAAVFRLKSLSKSPALVAGNVFQLCKIGAVALFAALQLALGAVGNPVRVSGSGSYGLARRIVRLACRQLAFLRAFLCRARPLAAALVRSQCVPAGVSAARRRHCAQLLDVRPFGCTVRFAHCVFRAQGRAACAGGR